MRSNEAMICVEPPIPDKYLTGFPGLLLREMLCAETSVVDGIPSTSFYWEGDRDEMTSIVVDDDFVAHFANLDPNDILKREIIAENEELFLSGALASGDEIEVTCLDIADILKAIIQNSGGGLSALEYQFVYECGDAGKTGGFCVYITADGEDSMSFEDWLCDRRAEHRARVLLASTGQSSQ